MDGTLKTIMLLVSLFLLHDCAADVNLVYKKPVPELKADLSEAPQVCIALISKDITDIKESLMDDFRRFVGKSVYIHEITNAYVRIFPNIILSSRSAGNQLDRFRNHILFAVIHKQMDVI